MMNSVPTVAGSQLRLLKELLGLAEEQRRALQDDQIQAFEALLDRRQRVIETLAGPSTEPLPENVIPFPGAADVADDGPTLSVVVRAILTVDRENESLLRDKMSALGATLRNLHRGRQAAQGYAVRLPKASSLDRTG
ncbi:MAG: flagellar protein FliT [Dehalococcoidia bacterium]